MAPSTDPTSPRPSDHERDAAEAAIEQEAAEIDARSPDAPERIAELEAEADALGLPTVDPADVDVTDRERR